MKLTLVGKNGNASGSECVIFGHVETDGGRFVQLQPGRLGLPAGAGGRDLAPGGSWQLRDMSPGADLAPVPALVTWSTTPATYCLTSGRLVVLSHGWSGIVRILDRRREYRFDLYSPSSRLLLLDVASEIVVDVTSLASTERNVLRLPPLPAARIVEHIVESRCWFRFLDPDSAAPPGWLGRLWDAGQGRAREQARLNLISSLLPALVPRAEGLAWSRKVPADPSENRALRDELRLVCSAVDGVWRRVSARA
jgi:hypothetical protein